LSAWDDLTPSPDDPQHHSRPLAVFFARAPYRAAWAIADGWQRSSSTTTTVVVASASACATATATDAFDTPPFLRAVEPLPTAPAPKPKRTIRLPGSVEPSDVVRALLHNADSAGTPIAAHLWLADPASNTLRLIHAEGPARPDSTPISIEGTVLGSALTRSLAQIEPVHRLRTPSEDSVVWRYALPLAAGDAKGVAAVDFKGPDRPDLERFTPIAGAMRGSLAGALALQVARNETASAKALADTSRDLARMLDPDDVISTALERAMALAAAQTGSVMLLDDAGKMRIAASRGLPPEVVAEVEIGEGEGIAGWVLASRQPLVVEDLDDRGPSSRRHGVRSAVSVPIADEDGILGVINVGSRTFHARFSESHLEALESLGRTTAVALRNARAATVAHDLYFDTLKALAVAMEAKDPYAHGATAMVLDYAIALGQEMGLTDGELDALRVASMLHDIGMSAAGDIVTVANRQLSTVEWGMLKMHPVIAAEILAAAPALRDAIPIVYHHHEHYDGGGYVGGLAGEGIPLGARILAVADSFVAMTSDRPYRSAMPRADAIGELVAQSGSQFDPHVVQAFAELLASGRYDSVHSGS
jgi:response regulator RpfG family c-di-GMP phosphodiesterase